MLAQRLAVTLLALPVSLLAAPPATTSASRPTSQSAPFIDLYLDTLQKLRDEHEAVDPADLKVWPTLKDDENAVQVAAKVAAALPHDGEATAAMRELDQPLRLPLNDEQRTLLKSYLAESAAAVELLAKLKDCVDYDWGEIPHGRLMDRFKNVPLTAVRTATDLLYERSLLDAVEGRHDTAFYSVGTFRTAADGVAGLGGMISYLVSVGIDSQADDLLGQLAWDMKIGTDANEVVDVELKSAINDLLDRAASRGRFVQALRSERVYTIDLMQSLGQTPDGKPTLLVAMNGLKMLEYFDAEITVLTSADVGAAAAARKKVEAIDDELRGRPLMLRPASMALPSIIHVERLLYRLQASHQAAATLLAIRLYRLDHGGELPATLDALVPKYLPSVPTDPEHTDQPFGYDAKRGIIWSVGDNGRNDGGNIGDETMSESERRRTTDKVYYLNPADRPKWLR